jgi:phage terminase large subunit GpA-like protein
MRSSPISNNCILSEADKQATFHGIIRSAAALWHPKERLNIWQWAERKRYLAKGVSAKSLEGLVLYSTAVAPHQRKPQESVTDPKVQLTVLIMASQLAGKTEMINNVVGYHMEHRPRNMVIMYPQLDAAAKYSKKKLTPMIEASPALAAIVKPARMRDSGNTILVKEFLGGSIFLVGANSPASLRGASGAVAIGDEIDSNPPSAGVEGDPVELLFKRLESFPDCVKLLSSTPTVKGLSVIWDWWELSDQQFWFVPCPKCGRYQKLIWLMVQWPKDEPEKAVLVCQHCAAALDDKQRLEMYFNGRWEATAPFKGIAGFHLNGIYAPWPATKGYSTRLHQMAVDFIRAEKKGELAMRVLTNTFFCELWEDAVEEIKPTEVAQRAEDYGPNKLPQGVILILAAMDVQKAFIQCETIGLGLDDETWGIESRKFEGDTEQDDVWQELADHLAKEYKRVDGAVLRVSASAIDMRHKPHKVRDFVRKSGIARVFPVYGVATHTPILVTTRLNKHYRLRTYAVASKLAKDTIFARLKLEEHGPRFMHFPRAHGYKDNYFQGLTAEVLKRTKVRGVVVERYEKIRDRNEELDIRVYFLACIDILKPALGIIDKHLRANLANQPAAVKTVDVPGSAAAAAVPEPKTPAPPVKGPGGRPPRPGKFGGKGFIGGWRK